MKIRFFDHYLNLPIAILALVETLLILSAPVVAEILLRGNTLHSLTSNVAVLWPKVVVFSLSVGLALTAMGLYNSRQRARTAGLLLRAFVAHLLALGFVVLLSFFAPVIKPWPSQLFLWCAVSFVFISLIRVVEGALLDEDAFKRRIIVYGAGQRAQSMLQLRRRADQRGFVTVGYMPAPGEGVMVEATKVLD